MTPPTLLAALLALLSVSAFADPPKKLDLSGLLGGPSPQMGPDTGSGSSGPEKDIVLAAIAEYTGQSLSIAMNTFQPLLGSMSMPDGKSVSFGEQQIKDAGKLLEQMITSGKIVIKPVEGHGAAGAWTPDITDKALTGGTFEVGDWKTVKGYGRNSRSFSELQKQDQFANTILHETGHMFYSVFTIVYGFVPQSQPAVVEQFASLYFWNGYRPIGLCKGTDECPYPHKSPCHDENCYSWKITNHGYGVGNATEYAARTISQEMCNSTGGSAYSRVLAPAFSN
jgi:hypothetical protein